MNELQVTVLLIWVTLSSFLFFSLERKEPKVQGRLKKTKNLSGSTKTFKPEPKANPKGRATVYDTIILS